MSFTVICFSNLSDHLTSYINSEFKGSCAAENFSCGRTKTAAIVNCVGDQFQLDLIADLKKLSFSLMLDGSNDTGVLKMLLMTVRIFDINHQQIMTKFFDISAAEMFSSVDKLFIKHGISRDFVTALGIDNTNANIGEHNSLKNRALEKNYKTFITGCPCHIFHNAACKSGSAFAAVIGFDIEDHCIDLFCWFDKSSQRKSILKKYYEFCNSQMAVFGTLRKPRIKKVCRTEILFPGRRFTR